MSWTKWQKIDSPPAYASAAVYEVRLTDCEGNPVQIPRFFELDERGIVSIGETTTMKGRQKQFMSALKRCDGHSEINLFYLLRQHCRLDDRFPGCGLEYRYRKENDESAAINVEHRMLKDYIIRFGEAPPLNSAIPKRYGAWAAPEAVTPPLPTQPSKAESV